VEVLPLLDAANALAPDNAEVLAITGLHQRMRFRFEQALQSLNRAIALNPNFAEAFVWRAGSYERKGDYQAMLADRERAYRLDPVSIETARSLVWAYGNYQRYDDAEAIVETMEALHPGHRPVLGMRLSLLYVQGRIGDYASVVENALNRFEGDEELEESREFALVQLGLPERVAESKYPSVQRAVAIAEGDAAREREVLDTVASTDWEMHWQYRHGTLDGLAAAVEKYIAGLEQEGRPWAESCDTTHALFFREVGKTESFDSIMKQCRQEYEPGIAAGYMCDCRWLNLVQYTVLTGDFDSAIERLEEWLDKGFSNNLLESNEVLSLLSEYPDYEKLMKKNQENVARQREIYLTQS
jgi:tetratricopeptide (TPR) repeat protein